MAFTPPNSNMTMQVSSALATSYQTKFNKDLLERVIQLTVLDQFAKKEPFPSQAGAKTMTFFRQAAGTSAEAVALTEGTIIGSSSTVTYTPILATMLQFGGAYQFSDIIGMTGLFNQMNSVKERIAEVAALHADDIVRNMLSGDGSAGAPPSTGLLRRYGSGAAAFSTPPGVMTVDDMLRAFTLLQIGRAPKKNGRYYMVVAPQQAYNMMLDTKWVNIGSYQDKTDYVKGEVGQLYGVRVVVGTNPYRHTTEGTFAASGTYYNAIALGTEAFATPILAGNSPYNPRIMIVNTPDHYDILNQNTSMGWKAYWCSVTLNQAWGVVVTSATTFV